MVETRTNKVTINDADTTLLPVVSSTARHRLILVASNSITCLIWLRVLFIYYTFAFQDWSSTSTAFQDDFCDGTLRPALFAALAVSMTELATSLLGLTRSKPLQVLLFASVRTGTELLVTPMIGCTSWQHLFTALCWSLGEVVRFGCFAVDGMLPDGRVAKSIRYTVGPILFPLGAAGEMFMVIRAASQGRPLLYLAAMLWPAGFYPLMKQLLRQRKKYFARGKAKPEIKQI
ncbi:hypothetical protein MHU86_18272 [Fragilaria crotonensis]|nr:hypothetical protein MHU86_18272 [Fragilaria crotonensis]